MNDFDTITNYAKGKTDKPFSRRSYFSSAKDPVDLIKRINKRKRNKKDARQLKTSCVFFTIYNKGYIDNIITYQGNKVITLSNGIKFQIAEV